MREAWVPNPRTMWGPFDSPEAVQSSSTHDHPRDRPRLDSPGPDVNYAAPLMTNTNYKVTKGMLEIP